MWRAGYQFVATRLPKCQYGFLQGLWGQGGGLFSFLLSISVLVKIISYIYISIKFGFGLFFWSLYNSSTSLCIVTWMLSEWHFCNLLLCVTSLEVSSNGTQCKQSRLELEVKHTGLLTCGEVTVSKTAKTPAHAFYFIHPGSAVLWQGVGQELSCSQEPDSLLQLIYSFFFFLPKLFHWQLSRYTLIW